MTKKNLYTPCLLTLWVVLLSVTLVNGQEDLTTCDKEYVEVITTFDLIDKHFLRENRSEEKDLIAIQEITKACDKYFTEDHLGLTAQVIFSISTLSSKIPRSNRVLNDLAEKGYAIQQQYNNPVHTTLFLHAMSVLELKRVDFNASLIFADSVLTFPVDQIQLGTLAGNYSIRGYCHEALGNVEAANNDFLKAAETFSKIPNSEHRRISVLDASARVSLSFGNIDEALRSSHNAIEELKKMEGAEKHLPDDYQVYRTHALMLRKSNKPQEALLVAQKVLKIVESRGEALPKAHARQTLAEVYADLNQSKEALANFEAAEEIFREQQNPVELLILLEYKSDFLIKSGRFEEAYFVKNRSLQLKDEIAALSQSDRILEIRDEHEVELVKNKLALAKTQQNLDKTQKIGMGLGLIFVILLLALLYSKLTQRKRRQMILEDLVQERTAKLKQKAGELKQSNEELERFAFITSHDLKSPIRNILGFMSLMKKKNNLSNAEEREEYLDITIKSAKQLQVIVDDVLNFSKIGENTEIVANLIRLNGYFENLKKQFSPILTEKSASIEISGSAEITIAEGYLNQIFTNLITNSLKFNKSSFPRVNIKIEQTPDDFVRIQLSDNGIGISKEFHGKIFEMFKRLHTPDSYEGTGLGLATCKKICESLNGKIEIESTLGDGATFTVTLPKDCSPALRDKTSLKTASVSA